MKKVLSITLLSILAFSCTNEKTDQKPVTENQPEAIEFPEKLTLDSIAQNPEGIEFDKNDNTFLLSSLNATPIIKVNLDGTFKPFTSGEAYPVSTAGLQIDYKNNRLLVAGFNGMELYDQDPETKGMSALRIYNLETGEIEKDINLSSLVPDAPAYFANDVAVDDNGNAYVSDWYAGVVYKIDMEGNASVFWKNETGIASGANGIDFHADGYLLVSLVSVGQTGLYENYGLVKIPTNDSKLAKLVAISDAGFIGFDGMVLKENGNVVGVTNNGTAPGGNTLIELLSTDNWETAKIVNSKSITASTTVAVTPQNMNYVINQDFSNRTPLTWTIERIKL